MFSNLDTNEENHMSNIANPKLTDFPKNRENPFISEMIQEIDPVKRRRMVATDNREVVQSIVDVDGIVTGQSAFVQYLEVDEKQFAKLYLSNLAAFWELKQPAIRVFTYILKNIKPNNDTIDFIVEDCMEYTNYKTKKAIFQGLAQLLEKS